jgi:hypothetical protein
MHVAKTINRRARRSASACLVLVICSHKLRMLVGPTNYKTVVFMILAFVIVLKLTNHCHLHMPPRGVAVGPTAARFCVVAIHTKVLP